MHKRSLAFISISLALILPGCTGGNFAAPAAVGNLTVTSSATAIRTEQTAQFAVEGREATSLQWTANGIPGGNDEVGYIYATGKYQEPAILPAEKHIVITATSFDNAALKGSAASICSIPFL